MLPQPPERDLTEEEISAHQAVHAKDAPGWMILMFYLVPGGVLMGELIGYLILAFSVTSTSDAVAYMVFGGAIILFLALTFGIGLLRARMMPEVQMRAKSERFRVMCKHAGIFLAFQLIVAPIVAIFIGATCAAIASS